MNNSNPNQSNSFSSSKEDGFQNHLVILEKMFSVIIKSTLKMEAFIIEKNK